MRLRVGGERRGRGWGGRNFKRLGRGLGESSTNEGETTLTKKRNVASVRCSAKVDKKRFGERVEAIFLERAVSRGLAIAKPWGDSERYDFIIDAGEKLWRVQVKSSSYKPIGRYGYPFKAYTRSWKCGNAYTADQIDVLRPTSCLRTSGSSSRSKH